jgi:hypothetical protein
LAIEAPFGRVNNALMPASGSDDQGGMELLLCVRDFEIRAPEDAWFSL